MAGWVGCEAIKTVLITLPQCLCAVQAAGDWMISIPDSNADLSKQCDVHTFRASAKGGQHVNKTESAVRITHRETKIVVTCQDERSQHRNKEIAFSRLRKKLEGLNKKRKKRIPTRATRASKERRLQAKKNQSTKKDFRKKSFSEEWCIWQTAKKTNDKK